MLLRFTFVPGGLTRRPWRRRRRGARRPMRGEPHPMTRWPSPPRGASDRPPWGSGFALERVKERGEIYIIMGIWCVFFFSFCEVFLCVGSVLRLRSRSQKLQVVEHDQQVPLLPSPGAPGALHVLEIFLTSKGTFLYALPLYWPSYSNPRIHVLYGCTIQSKRKYSTYICII